jgi:N-dimethylarginine dimethylaminohydrolase
MPDIFDHLTPGEAPTQSVFCMCRPTYLSTKISNNVFMKGEKPDVPLACNQFDRLAHIIEALGVEVVELPPDPKCQDATFVANVGLAIGKTFVLANYKAPGRACEIEPARKFFTSMGYNCIQPPFFYEGFADVQPWKHGVYFGGWGLFSTNEAFDWIEQQCGVKIVRIHEINPKVYHEDCVLRVVDEENFIVCKSGIDADSLKTLKKLGNVILTPEGIETTGITNCVLIPEKRLCLSGALNLNQPDYSKAMDFLLETMDKLGYDCIFVQCSAFEPSGGDLSCLINPLTHAAE